MTGELKPYVISVVTTRFSDIYLRATDDSEAMKMAKEYFDENRLVEPTHYRARDQLFDARDNSQRTDLIKDARH